MVVSLAFTFLSAIPELVLTVALHLSRKQWFDLILSSSLYHVAFDEYFYWAFALLAPMVISPPSLSADTVFQCIFNKGLKNQWGELAVQSFFVNIIVHLNSVLKSRHLYRNISLSVLKFSRNWYIFISRADILSEKFCKLHQSNLTWSQG